MPKTKTDQKIDIEGAVLTMEALEQAVKAASQKGLSSTTIIIDEVVPNFMRIREYNQRRFLNYCHKGTILQQATSKVQWEVLGVEEVNIPVVGSNIAVDYDETFIKMRSLKGGKTTGKKYTKQVKVDQFYMYDIVDVPDAVKVLWGDPKDNPPKKPGDKF
jgi:hypothetical protein